MAFLEVPISHALRLTAAIRCGDSSRGSGRSSAFGTFCFVASFAAWDAKAAPTLQDAKLRIAATLTANLLKEKVNRETFILHLLAGDCASIRIV